MTINLNPSERCSFLAAFSRAKYIIGSTPALFRPWFNRTLPLDRKRHAADMYLDILTQIGISTLSHDGLKVQALPEHENEATSFLKGKVTDNQKLAGFNIGSASATKCWAPDRFAQVADHLAKEGYKIIFLGSKTELPMVRTATGLMKESAIMATGQLSVGGLTAILKRLDLLITNDSGPMHIAVSQKTPLVALYGPSKPELYGPYAFSGATTVQANPLCTGCMDRMKHQCNDMRCMNDLTTQQVLNAVDATLNRQIKTFGLEG
jgi:heptosyltransferase-2